MLVEHKIACKLSDILGTKRSGGMERDLGDILDRWSIAKLKAERIGTDENKRELEDFEKELKSKREQYPEVVWTHVEKYIYDINDFIWQLEAGLKSGKESLKNPLYILDVANAEALAKIGATTILIRNFNHLRVGFKNLINMIVGEGYMDTKKDHLSENS